MDSNEHEQQPSEPAPMPTPAPEALAEPLTQPPSTPVATPEAHAMPSVFTAMMGNESGSSSNSGFLGYFVQILAALTLWGTITYLAWDVTNYFATSNSADSIFVNFDAISTYALVTLVLFTGVFILNGFRLAKGNKDGAERSKEITVTSAIWRGVLVIGFLFSIIDIIYTPISAVTGLIGTSDVARSIVTGVVSPLVGALWVVIVYLWDKQFIKGRKLFVPMVGSIVVTGLLIILGLVVLIFPHKAPVTPANNFNFSSGSSSSSTDPNATTN